MNKIFILFSLVSVLTFGQENYNFQIVNNQLEWQHVYETKMTKSEIEGLLKSNGIFKNLTIDENLITGNIENISADYKGAGKTLMGTSFYVINSTINGFFMFEFKDGKYRISLNGINLRTINESSYGGINIASANAITPLSANVIKNSKLRNVFLSNGDAKIYNHTFFSLFDFSKYQIKTTDW
jgi:hypothetical protein